MQQQQPTRKEILARIKQLKDRVIERRSDIGAIEEEIAVIRREIEALTRMLPIDDRFNELFH